MIRVGKLALGALSALFMFGSSVGAQAQVISNVSAVLDNADATWTGNAFGSAQPCNIVVFAGTRRYETRQVTVATAGTYTLADLRTPVDGGLGIYSGAFNPAAPMTGCIGSVDDNGSAVLAAGTYTIVLSSLFGNQLGNVNYTFNGPGAVTLASTPSTVPTMTEWAMILFGTILTGGAALYIQRRRQVV